MDYEKHYTLLIKRAINRTLDEYTEKHHIVPKCVGGTDNKDNIAALTPAEHYVAHQLLIKMYPREHKLIYAANMMSVASLNNSSRSSNKRYSWLKKQHITLCRARVGTNNPSYGKSWYYDPVTLANRKFLKEDVPANWVKGRKYNQNYCVNCLEKHKSEKATWCNKCKANTGKSCIVNGTEYGSVSIAADANGIDKEAMRLRITSKKFPDYYYLET